MNAVSKTFLYGIGLLSLILSSESLYAEKLSQYLSMTSYSIKDGLPSNQINEIYQDSHGYLWLGTNNGLSRYDGARFTNYSVVQGLSNNWITSIVEDHVHHRGLFIGTVAGGVCTFADGKFEAITAAGNVNALFEDLHGALWFVMNDTLFRMEGEQPTVIRTMPPSERGEILQLTNGLVAAGFRDQVSFHTEDGRLVYSIHFPQQPRSDIYSMLQARDGNLWVVTTTGAIYKYRDSLLLHVYRMEHVVPYELLQDGEKSLILRTDKGLLEFSTDLGPEESGKEFLISDALPGGWGGPIAIDREKTLWAGTWSRGLMKIADRRLINVSIPNMNGCVEDTNGHLWFGDKENLVEIYSDENGGWYSHRHSIGNPGGARFSDLWQCDIQNRLWFSLTGRSSSLRCYNISSRRNEPSAIVPQYDITSPHGGLWSFLVDRLNRCWLMSGDLSVTVIDLATMKSVRVFTGADGIPQTRSTALLEDRRGNIWLGSWDKGLAVFNYTNGLSGKFRVLTTADGLPHDGVRSLAEGRDGRILIGTRHGGLAILDTLGKITTISMRDGLLSNTVWMVKEDALRQLWLYTDVGLECVDGRSFKPLPMKPEFRGERLNWLGLYGSDNICFVSREAMKIFEYVHTSPALVPPPMYLTSMSVNGHQQALHDGMTFSHKDNNCTIEFICLSFREEGSIRYQYRLIGADTLWSGPIQQRAVTFASLDPGSYTFQVRGFTSDGTMSAMPAAISFEIRPPFWSTWWFIAIIIASSGGILSLFYRYRVKRIREVERLRMRIASDLHDDIGTNLSSIMVTTQIMEKKFATSPEGEYQLRYIGTIAARTQEMMRDIVWMLNPQYDSLHDLVLKMKETTERLLQGFDHTFITPEGRLPDTLDIEFKRNLFLIFKEVLNNIVRHSSATRVGVAVSLKQGIFTLSIEDNGRGFDAVAETTGTGLGSVRRRAKQMDGTITIASTPGAGTRFSLIVKIT